MNRRIGSTASTPMPAEIHPSASIADCPAKSMADVIRATCSVISMAVIFYGRSNAEFAALVFFSCHTFA